MRALVALLIALTVGLGTSLVAMAADECAIGDAALCLANPNCHWDGSRRGCYPGPAEHPDACSVHSEQEICDLDTTLGCKWSAETKTCVTKAN